MTDLYRMLPEEMDDLVTKLGQPRYRADQLLQALYNESPKKMSDVHQIPTAMRDALVKDGYTIRSEDEVHRVVIEDGHS
ncbi:MAG: 23S rRNA (adenine(2503)-C(2))-methyltransferase RlmN, partial [Nitrosotalea sp.]